MQESVVAVNVAGDVVQVCAVPDPDESAHKLYVVLDIAPVADTVVGVTAPGAAT